MEDASRDRHHLFLEFHAKLNVTLGIKNMHPNVAITVGDTPNYFRGQTSNNDQDLLYSHVSK